ncbi:hypothetical protein PENSPDRAFT_659611 [Peniophora sp. CONT]|nr:hypothetical protein PENSPDRAFT_659611 [Peniophora sp. CONT]
MPLLCRCAWTNTPVLCLGLIRSYRPKLGQAEIIPGHPRCLHWQRQSSTPVDSSTLEARNCKVAKVAKKGPRQRLNAKGRIGTVTGGIKKLVSMTSRVVAGRARAILATRRPTRRDFETQVPASLPSSTARRWSRPTKGIGLRQASHRLRARSAETSSSRSRRIIRWSVPR